MGLFSRTGRGIQQKGLCLQVFDTAQQDLAATGQPPSSRGCKYALNTLMQTFQLKNMALNVAAGPVSLLSLCCPRKDYTLRLQYCPLL